MDSAGAALSITSSERPDAMQARSSDTSEFFHLPLELRDKIYDLAIGSKPLYFTITGQMECVELDPIVMAAALSYDHESLPPYGWVASKSRGLMDWMRTSRKILAESVDLVSRAFIFRPLPSMYVSCRTAPANLLLFDRGLLCNALVHDRLEYWACGQLVARSKEENKIFRSVMHKLGSNALNLELLWDQTWEAYEDGLRFYDPARYVESWDELWNGRMRRAKITVKCMTTRHDIKADILVKQAEYLAERFVGPGGEMVRVESPTGIDTRKISITVQRKV